MSRVRELREFSSVRSLLSLSLSHPRSSCSSISGRRGEACLLLFVWSYNWRAWCRNATFHRLRRQHPNQPSIESRRSYSPRHYGRMLCLLRTKQRKDSETRTALSCTIRYIQAAAAAIYTAAQQSDAAISEDRRLLCTLTVCAPQGRRETKCDTTKLSHIRQQP